MPDDCHGQNEHQKDLEVQISGGKLGVNKNSGVAPIRTAVAAS